MRRTIRTAVVLLVTSLSIEVGAGVEQSKKPVESLPLYIGWAQVDITPERPVALIGQLHKRISKGVLDPLTVTVLAMETRSTEGPAEQAVMVSCDVLYIRQAVQERLRDAVKAEIPDFDTDKLLLNATHTHTGPGFADGAFKGRYDVSTDEGVMKASEYMDFFVERVSKAVVKAWRDRAAATMNWGLGHAVVGMNRRARYFNGSAVMYGATNREDFSHIEGYEDHAVEMLFFWAADGHLTGLIINVACTAQETEGLYEISADFWHDTRLEVRRRLSGDVFIFAQCSAAGDVSPHLMYRTQAEDRMRERRGLSRRQEIARRIANAVEDVLPTAAADARKAVLLRHKVVRVDLPAHEGASLPFYELDSITGTEVHIIRLGEVIIATNPFELYVDYGVRIKAASPALLTFLVQTSCGHCGYLPTGRAVAGGGYSADAFLVGPAGGQVLVHQTLQSIRDIWD